MIQVTSQALQKVEKGMTAPSVWCTLKLRTDDVKHQLEGSQELVRPVGLLNLD